MPRNEEDEGDGFNVTVTEMLNTFIAQWGDTTRRLQESSEDKQKVNLMRSLGFVAGGLANLLIFLTIALVIGVIVAIIPK